MRKNFNVDEIKKAVDLCGGRVPLAKKINLSYQTVSDWANNKKTPSLDNCIKIERATNGSVRAKDILPDYPWDQLK
jgi:DNA-binding transcriptional regulator YdaS (Cro superfamily)